MKIIDLLITKLYDNFVYGKTRPRMSQFILAKISVSLILLWWWFVVLEFFKQQLGYGVETSLEKLYFILFFVIFYFLYKNTWTISEAEDFMNDRGNETILSRMIWVFWLSLALPVVAMTFIFARF